MISPRNISYPLSYRHTFQGQEKDDEIKGKGNSINYTFRMYDTRLGRFLSIDPLSSKYAHNSPYTFSENRVIDGVEFEGLEYSSTVTYDSDNLPVITITISVYVINRSENPDITNQAVDKVVKTANSKLKNQFGTDIVNREGTKVGSVQFELKYDGEIHDASDAYYDEPQFTLEFKDKIENLPEYTAYGAGETQGSATLDNPVQNEIEVKVTYNGATRTLTSMANTTIHELFHTGGLRHENDPDNPHAGQMGEGNIMYSMVLKGKLNWGTIQPQMKILLNSSKTDETKKAINNVLRDSNKSDKQLRLEQVRRLNNDDSKSETKRSKNERN